MVRQKDGSTLPEAVRRLVEKGLAAARRRGHSDRRS